MKASDITSSLRAIVSALHKGLRRQISNDKQYSMTEIETIGCLSRYPSLLPTELASFTRVKTQSMSQILVNLYEQGIIKRTPSKTDKRKVYISLTPLGRKMVEKAKYEKDEWLKNLIDNSLTVKDKELLIKALPVLNKLIEIK